MLVLEQPTEIDRVATRKFESKSELEGFIARHQKEAHGDRHADVLACEVCSVLDARLAEMEWLEGIPADVHA